MNRFLATTIIGSVFFSRSLLAEPSASDADPRVASQSNCAAVIHSLADVSSLSRLAQSYRLAFKPQIELAIYKHILQEYRDIGSERRLDTLIQIGIVSGKLKNFAEAEAAFTEARELALASSQNRLIQIYLESSRLYANWGLALAEINQEINPAYFQLAKTALEKAQSISDPAQREVIIEAARELDIAITKGVRLPSGITIDTTTPVITEVKKRARLEVAKRADRLYQEAEYWLWSYYDSHDLRTDDGTHDTRGLLSRAVSVLSQVYRLNPDGARGEVYLRLKEIRKKLNSAGIARSVAEQQASELIYRSLFRPWQDHLTDFVSILKNSEGKFSDEQQTNYGNQLFDILIATPNRIRDGIPGSGGQAAAPITAGQMYEALLQSVESWSPSSAALIDLKQTWLGILNHELLMTTEHRTDLAPTLTTYR